MISVKTTKSNYQWFSLICELLVTKRQRGSVSRTSQSNEGEKRAVENLVGEETFSKYVQSMRVPDWVLPFFQNKGPYICSNLARRTCYPEAWKNRGKSDKIVLFTPCLSISYL